MPLTKLFKYKASVSAHVKKKYVKISFKKGNPDDKSNYRPISTN